MGILVILWEEVTIANLREAYGAASMQSLQWDETCERAIDRVASAGRCHPVGIELWRARYSLDANSYKAARKHLLRCYLERYKSESPDIAQRVVEQCLHEYLSPSCAVCHGAKEIVAGYLRHACKACEGTGIHRYSDTQRSRIMHLSYGQVKAVAHKITWLLGQMNTWDAAVNAQMNVELERLR